jgi:hypothetical protein
MAVPPHGVQDRTGVHSWLLPLLLTLFFLSGCRWC